MAYIKMSDVVEYLSAKDRTEKILLGLALKLRIIRYFGVGIDIVEKYLTQAEGVYNHGVYYHWEDFYSSLSAEESKSVNHVSKSLNDSLGIFNVGQSV